MLKIGITGGIGSGKTTVCKIFESLGIPVYYADDRAKWLMANQADLKSKISELFGEEAYDESGQLNRGHIAKIAFSNPEILKELNAIVHPAVGEDGIAWMKEQEQKNVPYALKEAALIFESGSYKQLDKVITVYAPEYLRIERVMKRDNSTREAIKSRIDKQMPEEKKIALSDYVIYNNGKQSLIQQVIKIHQQLKQLNEI